MRKRAARHAVTFSIAAAAAVGLVAVGAPATAAPTVGTGAPGASAAARPSPSPQPTPTSIGTGGAVASVDADASAIGLAVLAGGGNAVDAAVATAAALGVTEPYSAGIGGGGYFVYFDAATGEVHTVDGRETAPAGITHDAFIDPSTGAPYPFSPQLVSSGVAVGVPGTVATWQTALDEWGTTNLRQALKPAIRLARDGFTVDSTFRLQTQENQARFAAFPDTAALFLPGGDAPQVGATFRNPDLAKTLQQLSAKGADEFYTGRLAAEIVDVVQSPPKDPASTLPAPAGSMTLDDLAGYEALQQDPTHVEYRGLDVYGMAPSSSGGTTVGESLNILENHAFDAADPGQTHHLFFEATARAFADRGAYVGDPAFVDVPTDVLLSQEFAEARRGRPARRVGLRDGRGRRGRRH